MMAAERGQRSSRRRAMKQLRLTESRAAQLMARGRWRAQDTAKAVTCWPSNAACPHKNQCISPLSFIIIIFSRDRVAIMRTAIKARVK